MKKLSRWLAPMLALVLVMSVAFSGCGSKTETDAQLLETFSELLAKDYEVYYLFMRGDCRWTGKSPWRRTAPSIIGPPRWNIGPFPTWKSC